MTATGLEPKTIYFVNKHSTIWINWPNYWAVFWVLICTVAKHKSINAQTQKYNSKNIAKSISDNLPQFIITENGKRDNPVNKIAKTPYRDYKSFHLDSFKIDLQCNDWTFVTHSNDVNLGFETFLRLFHTHLGKHAPIKEFTKK